MGGGETSHDRGQYNYHSHTPHQHCSQGTRSVITGDLGQGRDFHYTVEPVYRRPREVVAYHSPAATGGHLQPQPQRQRQRDGNGDYAYVDQHKASPFHGGNGGFRGNVRQLQEEGLRSGREDRMDRLGRLDQNYMLVRERNNQMGSTYLVP